ncbi:putative FAD monooxygenase [Rosellinia necatrix]|uniref:Putative FAD monooxygenase n=1 Tax=Rosellinia necatrix TaxID=77044 RepID=A0A1W2TS44_ROSNE|nr:putative FAD monooxygenase [Rosellinia necatrix]
MEETVDLAIIGGGPTGLLSALLARRQGLSVCIIDAKPAVLDLGRADALNARTQQYFEVSGVLDELLPQGLKCNTSSTFAEGEFKSQQNKWWTSIQHCAHPNFLMIGQPQIEKAIADHLDIPVHYGERVVSVSETRGGASILTDRQRKVHCKYAIAADGARSTMRSALGIEFTGTKPEMIWAVLDTFIDTDFPECPEIITFQLNEQSRVSWIPRERGMARFYILLDGEITQQRAEDSIREHMAPHRIDFVKTEWFSTFDVKERLASTFISKEEGRIFLAGDAAHVHSVNGGQGLNTGVADAFALSWRLAMAIKHPSLTPESRSKLLQSYDTERRLVAKEVIDIAAKLVRDTKMTAKKYVGTIEKNAGYITGMGVSYDGLGSSMVIESEQAIWEAGKRCPDILISKVGSDGEKRLYSTVPYGKFLVLQLGTARTPPARFEEEAIHFTLLPRDAQREKADNLEETWVADGQAFPPNVVSGEGSLVVIVRPDMYIAYVGDGGWLETSKSSLVQGLLDQSDAPAPPLSTDKPEAEEIAKSKTDSKPWLQILGAFFLYFNTWGLISSYGSFQAFYEVDLLSDQTPFVISIIGSLQTFLMVFLGFVTGPIYDAGYFRYLLTAGSFFVTLGTLSQSFCTQYWQLLLAQGVAVGIGCGCFIILSVAIPSMWFTTKLPLANGIAASGSGVGGIILPILIRNLLPKVGFGWTVRVITLIIIVTLGISNIILRGPSGSKQRRKLIHRSSLSDWPYVTFVIGCCCVFLGIYTPFFYIQSYAISRELSSPNTSFYIVAAMNLSSIFGRIIPNFFTHLVGPLLMIMATSVTLLATAFGFIGAQSIATVFAVAVVYGFFTGTFFALQPTVFVRLTKDMRFMGTRFGMAFSVMSISLLFGPPIAGALQRVYGYEASWIWSGATMLLGTGVFIFSFYLSQRK